MSATGRKRWVRIILLLLGLLVMTAGALSWRFCDEIRAFGVSRQYSTGELEDQLATNDQTIQDTVDAAPDVTVRPPTEEERQALKEGTLSQEELAERLTAPDVAGEKDTQTPTEQPPEGTAQPLPSEPPQQGMSPDGDPSAYQNAMSALVARVYVLREQYINELDAMEEAAKADYRGLLESERTGKKLASLVNRYLTKAVELEGECDAQMDTIVAEMQALVRENNGTTELVDTVIESYANEKNLKKAWYMSRLQEKGLV